MIKMNGHMHTISLIWVRRRKAKQTDRIKKRHEKRHKGRYGVPEPVALTIVLKAFAIFIIAVFTVF